MAGTTKEYLVHKVDRYSIQYVVQSNRTIKLFPLLYPADPHGGGPSRNHVLSDGSICVSAGNEPRTMDRAEATAHHWMTGYSAYIRDPKGRFRNTATRVDV